MKAYGVKGAWCGCLEAAYLLNPAVGCIGLRAMCVSGCDVVIRSCFDCNLIKSIIICLSHSVRFQL